MSTTETTAINPRIIESLTPAMTWLSEHPLVADAFVVLAPHAPEANAFVKGVWGALFSYGHLTDRQADAIVRTARRAVPHAPMTQERGIARLTKAEQHAADSPFEVVAELRFDQFDCPQCGSTEYVPSGTKGTHECSTCAERADHAIVMAEVRKSRIERLDDLLADF